MEASSEFIRFRLVYLLVDAAWLPLRHGCCGQEEAAAGSELMAARPSQAATLRFLAEANEVAKEAVLEGNHPFGAVLVDPQAGGGEGEVLLRQGNIDTANHAESTLAREAFAKYPLDQLQRCTLYTTFEPCAVNPPPPSDPGLVPARRPPPPDAV